MNIETIYKQLKIANEDYPELIQEFIVCLKCLINDEIHTDEITLAEVSLLTNALNKEQKQTLLYLIEKAIKDETL